MAVHARLKNEFTEDKKYHNLMTWLISSFQIKVDVKILLNYMKTPIPNFSKL